MNKKLNVCPNAPSRVGGLELTTVIHAKLPKSKA